MSRSANFCSLSWHIFQFSILFSTQKTFNITNNLFVVCIARRQQTDKARLKAVSFITQKVITKSFESNLLGGGANKKWKFENGKFKKCISTVVHSVLVGPYVLQVVRHQLTYVRVLSPQNGHKCLSDDKLYDRELS